MPVPTPAEFQAALSGELRGPDGSVLAEGAAFDETLPAISVVVVHDDAGHPLEDCLKSIFGQSHGAVECLVLLACPVPTDDLPLRYAEKVRWLPASAPLGEALRAALDEARGELQAWLRSCDFYLPGAFATVAQLFARHSGVAWVTGRPSVWDGSERLHDVLRTPPISLSDHLFLEGGAAIHAASNFWRRDLWRATAPADCPRPDQAWEFAHWLRLLDKAEPGSLDALLGGSGNRSPAGPAVSDAIRGLQAQRLAGLAGVAEGKSNDAAMEIVTSLVPGQEEVQRPAVRSWQRLGFRVVSLNAPEELPHLDGRYPGVKLVAAKRNGKARVGKPCIYFDDILDYFRGSDADVFGIVNADVHLYGDRSLTGLIRRESAGALVYGARYEVETAESATGWQYWMGFDFFFFDRSLLRLYPPSPFMLGVTWWDYWAPLWPALKGYPIKHLVSPIAYHVSHPINYDRNQLEEYGNLLAGLIGNSVPARLHRQFQAMLDQQEPEGHPHRSVAMLAIATRYAIRRAAQPLRWLAPSWRQLGNLWANGRQDGILVTAIVSTYASAAFIAECLEDLVSQTIADRIEIIVVDAASPEDERSIVERYQGRHANVRYLRTPDRIGVYAAWNLAVRQARGRYLISCSTNDRLAPDTLELLARILDERPEYAIAYGSSYVTRTAHQSPDGFDFGGAYVWPIDSSFAALLKQPGIGPHPMWRRSLHDEFGDFDEGFAAIADQDFWLRVARHRPVLNIHDVTGLYWATEDSLSGKVARAQAEYREINERHRQPFAYQSWKTTRYFSKGVARHYEQRMAQWRYQPNFHVVIRHSGGNFDALSRTIQSLTAQHYPNVRIVVLSPQPVPQGITGERFAWATCPADRWRQGIAAAAPAGEHDWLLLLAEGDTVDPRTFLALGEAIHGHPEWRVIHADEDELPVEAARETEVPHFKPGIDPDRLLAVPYLGEAAAISAAWLARLGGLAAEREGAEVYDLCLRTLEAVGRHSIGLVQDILLHRPAGRYDLRATEVHRRAASDHLGRRGLAATVLPGIADTMRVVYGHRVQPPVAVLICFGGSIAPLERALASLMEKTRYADYRIVVADCRRRSDPASDAFLAGLAAMGSERLGVFGLPARVTEAEAVRQFLDAMREGYLLVWPETAIAVQEDWLAAMMNHAQRDGVVAVGPRLVTGDGLVAATGMEIGVLGPADSPYKGVRMEYPGEGATLVTDHRVSALDARCLLLRGDAVRQAGGIDPGMGDRWALDLAMRLDGQGDLIWTPYAITLVAEDLAGLEKTDIEQTEKNRSVATRRDDAFYRRWFARLGRDEYRNANWARNGRGHVPEVLPALVFDPLPWRPVAKIVARLGDREGCGHYRVMAPMRALMGEGLARGGVSLRDFSVAEMSAVEADVWIFQRQIGELSFAVLDDFARYAPAFRIYEIDDLITQIPEGNPHRGEFTPAMLERFRRGVGLCQRLVVATEPLAAAYSRLTDETVVVPNFLPPEPWRNLAPRRRRGIRPRVGWAGSASHDGDLKMMAEVVAGLAGEVDWVFLGRCPAAMRPYLRELHRPVDIDDYPAKLASLDLDLAIAPLEVNAFNEAKSHLKLLEYGVLGYPVVCTDIVPYQSDFPVTRVRNRAKDWIAAIREITGDREAAAELGRQLREHVLAHWMLEDHLDEWIKAWLP
jgi:glycosyltransferase involved in cell wall biosynthesis